MVTHHHVNELAAAVIALAGIPLGIFVGQRGGSGGQDGSADVIFAGDEFEGGLLAAGFSLCKWPARVGDRIARLGS